MCYPARRQLTTVNRREVFFERRKKQARISRMMSRKGVKTGDNLKRAKPSAEERIVSVCHDMGWGIAVGTLRIGLLMAIMVLCVSECSSCE